MIDYLPNAGANLEPYTLPHILTFREGKLAIINSLARAVIAIKYLILTSFILAIGF